MTILFIFLLVVISIFLVIANYKKLSLVMLTFTLLFFLGVGNGFLPSCLLQNLESSYTNMTLPAWEKRNAIIVLGAGAIKIPETSIVKLGIIGYSRVYEAARLYFSCKKSGNECRLILSGGDALKVGKPEAVIYQDMLLDLGVNNADLILDSKSMNTYKNAEFTSAILKKGNFNRVFLVTSAMHMKRSELYFSRFDVYPVPIFSDYFTTKISFVPLAINFTLMDMVIHEYIGVFRFHVYNFLGWNSNVLAAGTL